MWVESPGSPPFEKSQMTFRLLKFQMMPSVVAGNMTGRSSGAVNRMNCVQEEAPSSLADS